MTLTPFSFKCLALIWLTTLAACNNPQKIKKGGKQIGINIAKPETKKDTISIWIYDYTTELPIKNKTINPDTLTPKKVINFINQYKGGAKILLDFLKISHDTIYVKIQESTYLTQQIGTTGADDYMSTTTFTLTELKNIKYVNFAFEEGDHAVPGTYSRLYYIKRNK